MKYLSELDILNKIRCLYQLTAIQARLISKNPIPEERRLMEIEWLEEAERLIERLWEEMLYQRKQRSISEGKYLETKLKLEKAESELTNLKSNIHEKL